jgi:hypothetical protein
MLSPHLCICGLICFLLNDREQRLLKKKSRGLKLYGSVVTEWYKSPTVAPYFSCYPPRQKCLALSRFLSFVFSSSDNHSQGLSRRICRASTIDVRCLAVRSEGRRKPSPTSYCLQLNKIEAVLTANSFTFPSPDSTFSLEFKASRIHPDIQSAGSLISPRRRNS